MDQNTTVIVLSDDEDEGESTIYESSVLIVEENEGTDAPKTSEVLDEDVTITFSRKAHVLPHARYDCTIPFCFTEGDVTGPEDSNAAYCEQCFCYVCDKLASTCQFWVIPGFCHCNAHKRSFYWKSLRDKRIMGYLHELNFTFDPMDMDADLRRAEASLQQFACSLALKFAAFLVGVEKPKQPICCYCQCHSTNSRTTESHSASGSEVGCKSCRSRHVYFPEYDYSGVQERVCMFLDDAKQENPKSSIVMLLGAMKLIISHSAPGNTHSIKEVSRAVDMLLYRYVNPVTPVFCSSAHLLSTLQPVTMAKICALFGFSLNVLPWNDPLLSAVLKGQNVSGERRVKGRRAEVLLEPIVVIRARVQKLQQQKKYRELALPFCCFQMCTFLNGSHSCTLQDLSDWAPFYLCKVGDYAGAVNAMFSSMSGSLCPASRLSPAQFCAYLRIFVSGHAPSDMPNPLFLNIQPDPFLSSTWTPVQGGSLLKRLAVVKFALRVLNCNDAVFAQGYPDQALLLLATQALALRICHSRLCPALHIVMQLNPWALYWLFYSLVGQPNVVLDFLCVVLEELLENPKQDTAGHCFVANFLHLFFLEHTVVFDPSTYPTNELVARWNEAQHPWQYHLRQMLEIKVILLISLHYHTCNVLHYFVL
uniref:Uncharacterized protein n=1 Tax=Electrophorus electricus TaxID=8005 RepID=A0A4W4GNH4_ELEEL